MNICYTNGISQWIAFHRHKGHSSNPRAAFSLCSLYIFWITTALWPIHQTITPNKYNNIRKRQNERERENIQVFLCIVWKILCCSIGFGKRISVDFRATHSVVTMEFSYHTIKALKRLKYYWHELKGNGSNIHNNSGIFRYHSLDMQSTRETEPVLSWSRNWYKEKSAYRSISLTFRSAMWKWCFLNRKKQQFFFEYLCIGSKVIGPSVYVDDIKIAYTN